MSITKLDLFGPVTPESAVPIVVAKTEKPLVNGWHSALNWLGTDVLFFGFWCETCHQRSVTPHLKDVGTTYPVVVRHCGREERITIGELLAANLPTVRTEPHHYRAAGVITIGGTNLMPVGDFGDNSKDDVYNGTNAGPKDTEDQRAQLDGMLF